MTFALTTVHLCNTSDKPKCSSGAIPFAGCWSWRIIDGQVQSVEVKSRAVHSISGKYFGSLFCYALPNMNSISF